MPSTRQNTKLQVEVAPCVPYLARVAAAKAGFPSSSQWVRVRLAELLARELAGTEDAVTFEEIMEDMPVPWHENPGAVRLKSASKSGEEVGQVG